MLIPALCESDWRPRGGQVDRVETHRSPYTHYTSDRRIAGDVSTAAAIMVPVQPDWHRVRELSTRPAYAVGVPGKRLTRAHYLRAW